MGQALDTLKEQIVLVEKILEKLREEFDRTDANHPHDQAIAAQNITIAAARLDALKHIYKVLGGE